jgi:hypothetical protein
MNESQQLASEACRLIGVHIGEKTATLYKDFYKDKDSETVLASVGELLSEVVGEARAQAELTALQNKLQLKGKLS